MAGKRRAEPPGRAGRPEPGSGVPQQGRPVAASPVSAPIKTRRQARQERRERRRKIGRWGIAGIAAVVAIVAAAVGFGVHSITTGRAQPSHPQTTLLLQVTDPAGNGTAAGAILFGHDSTSHVGVELLVPSALITNVCGFGEQSFGDILALPDGAQQAATTLSSDLQGLRVDGTWTLTTAQLASLVTAVGGVTVDVDVNVTRPGPHGTSIVELQSGKQQLDGSQAALFATYRNGAGEDASARLARLQSVVQAAVDKLGALGVTAAERILGGLHAPSSFSTARLAQLLVGLAGDDKRNGGVLPSDLPTVKLDTGGSPAYNLDSGQAMQFVRANFGPSLPKHPPSGLQVLVKNGYGTPGLVPSACKRLTDAGMRPQGSGNSGTGLAHTEILINARTVSLAEQGDRVARVLRLPLSDVQVNPVPSNFGGVVVLLGGDYKP